MTWRERPKYITVLGTLIRLILRLSSILCFPTNSQHPTRVRNTVSSFRLFVKFPSDIVNENRAGACSARPPHWSIRVCRDTRHEASRSSVPSRSFGYNRVSHFARLTLLLRFTFSRHRLSSGANEKIQLTALLGAFKNAVELTAKYTWLIMNQHMPVDFSRSVWKLPLKYTILRVSAS